MIEVRKSRDASEHHMTRPLRWSGGRLLASCFLSREEQQALEGAVSSPKSFRANTNLVGEGDRSENLFIIVEGWACRYTTTRYGARYLPALLVQGDVGNLDSLMFDRPEYGVRTLTPTISVTLRRERALALGTQHPGIARTFAWLALVENAILTQRAISLARRSAKERLAHFLCELSVRLGGEDGEASRFAFPLTQEQIADALGLTSVHVNRTMQQLRADDLVAIADRTMTLPDVARLRHMCGFDPHYLHLDPLQPADLRIGDGEAGAPHDRKGGDGRSPAPLSITL